MNAIWPRAPNRAAGSPRTFFDFAHGGLEDSEFEARRAAPRALRLQRSPPLHASAAGRQGYPTVAYSIYGGGGERPRCADDRELV
jgi:hypothetical protein